MQQRHHAAAGSSDGGGVVVDTRTLDDYSRGLHCTNLAGYIAEKRVICFRPEWRITWRVP